MMNCLLYRYRQQILSVIEVGGGKDTVTYTGFCLSLIKVYDRLKSGTLKYSHLQSILAFPVLSYSGFTFRKSHSGVTVLDFCLNQKIVFEKYFNFKKSLKFRRCRSKLPQCGGEYFQNKKKVLSVDKKTETHVSYYVQITKCCIYIPILSNIHRCLYHIQISCFPSLLNVLYLVGHQIIVFNTSIS